MSDNIENVICNCPKCNSAGVSVGAMNYKETQQWHKEGDFSASGGAIGTFGLGIGSGGGSYSETGESATKRANVFAEPKRFVIPTGAIFAFAIFAIGGVFFFPMLINILNTATPDIASHATQNSIANLDAMELMNKLVEGLKYIIPLIVVTIIISTFLKIQEAQKREDRLNKVVYVKQMKRYNELRYCENCHTLFDNRSNSSNANELGMEEMMKINPLS